MPGIPFDDPCWDAILDDFRSSGLTHAESCRRRRLPLASFRRRLYRDRPARVTAGPAAPSPTPGFVPVTVAPDPAPAAVAPHQPLELILPHGRRLAIAPGFDPETLRRLLGVLEAPPCSD
jgi:hypothetical protein